MLHKLTSPLSLDVVARAIMRQLPDANLLDHPMLQGFCQHPITQALCVQT